MYTYVLAEIKSIFILLFQRHSWSCLPCVGALKALHQVGKGGRVSDPKVYFRVLPCCAFISLSRQMVIMSCKVLSIHDVFDQDGALSIGVFSSFCIETECLRAEGCRRGLGPHRNEGTLKLVAALFHNALAGIAEVLVVTHLCHLDLLVDYLILILF